MVVDTYIAEGVDAFFVADTTIVYDLCEKNMR